MSAPESGWVIERYVNGVLYYWTGRAANSFDMHHSEAIRFVRRQDAAVVLAWLCDGMGRAAEHIWLGRREDGAPENPQGAAS